MAFLEIKGPKSVFVNPAAIVRVEGRSNEQPGANVVLVDGTSYEVAEVETVVLQRIEMVAQAAIEAGLTLVAGDPASSSGDDGS